MNDDRLAALNALLKEALALHEQGVGTLARAVMTFLSERAKEPGAEPLAQVLAQATSEVSDQDDAGWNGVPQNQAQAVELFDQSRWALSQGLWWPAQIGFQIMESLLSSDAEQRMISWLWVGRETAAAGMRSNRGEVVLLGVRAMQLSPADSSEFYSALLGALWSLSNDLARIDRYNEAAAGYIHFQRFCDALPDSEAVRASRASVRMNRANNLQAQGQRGAAETLYAEAQSLFDALPDSEAVRTDRARVRTNRANNLQAQGQHGAAETLYAEAQSRFDALPDSNDVRDSRASVRTNRASNLQAQGQHGTADTLYAEAQSLFDALPDSEAVRASRARVRTNRANNLQEQGQHGAAETLYAEAQSRFDALPDSEAVRANRARVRMNRANNLRAQGQHGAAESLYAEAQPLFDALPDSEVMRADRARIRANWASNLMAQGLHGAAETLYAEAQRLFDALPDSEAVRADRARIRVNRANNLSAQGQYEAAEALYAEAQPRFDALPDSEAVRASRASVRMNRANNLVDQGQHGAAETLYAEAQSRFDALPDSEAVRADRAGVRVNRIRNLIMSGRPDAARGTWAEGVQVLQSLQGHSGSDYGQLVRRYSWDGIRLFRRGVLSLSECEMAVLALCRSGIDHLDCAPEVLAEEPSGPPASAKDIAALLSLAVSWLIEIGHTGQAVALLAEYSGRYANAQRLLAEEAANPKQDAERHPVTQLRLQLRDANWALRAWEAQSTRGDDFALKQARLRQERDTLRDALLAAVREHGAGETSHDLSTAFLSRRLGPEGRALVLLLRVSEPDGDGMDDIRDRALALVLAPGATDFQRVPLPEGVWLAAAHPDKLPQATISSSPQRGANTRHGQPVMASGLAVRAAVDAGWAAITPFLGNAREVFVGVNQHLAQLPWQVAEDEGGRKLYVHYGVHQVVQALTADPAAAVAAPDPQRPLGVLAHSPEDPLVIGQSLLSPIPGVEADQAIALALCPTCEPLRDREAFLQSTSPLLQLSCHGLPDWVHTGPDEPQAGFTSVYDFDRALRERKQVLDALILLACSTGQANDNAWGEVQGWSAVLGDRARLVVAPLYPVDDLLCSLFVLILLREWQASGDLRQALTRTRTRLRSGQWADSDAQTEGLCAQWYAALGQAYDDDPDPIEQARGYAEARHLLYRDPNPVPDNRLESAALQRLTEAFVVFG